MIPLSLYVHIPWCVRKCPYCDFNSHESAGALPEAAYVQALLEDLEEELGRDAETRAIESIFIGGGTPSLFSEQAIDRLMSGIRERATLAVDAEVTMEANPGTLEAGQSRLAGYRSAGVNRLSIGAQSFDADCLDALGRIHSPADITRAFEAARRAGFERINLDVMQGLPGQTVDLAMSDIDRAIALEPEHISWYELTIETNTMFYSRPPVLPDEDTMAQIYEQGRRRLEDAGFQRYEVSAFARDGEESRHNLNYWQFGDYLGIGAGAHGKMTRNRSVERTSKSRAPQDYLASRRTRREPVVGSDVIFEFLLNALRLSQGFRLETFEARTGVPRSALAAFLLEATRRELVASDGTTVRPTERGLDYLNDLLMLADAELLARA